jgi:hypothetical protein
MDDLPEPVRSNDTFAIPWLTNPGLMREDEKRLAKAFGRKAQSTRKQTLRSSPRKYTPAPVETEYMRGSIAIEPVMAPRQDTATTEIAQGNSTSMSSGGMPSGNGALRDSEVLGIENGVYTVQARSFFNHD